MEYDPALAALLAQPWSNNVCRGYVIYAMENCGFSAGDIRRVVAELYAVSADALADVSGMAFDRTLPREERLARFVRRAVNPYCFSVGGVGVKIEFAEGGPSLQETLAAFLIRQKSGL